MRNLPHADKRSVSEIGTRASKEEGIMIIIIMKQASGVRRMDSLFRQKGMKREKNAHPICAVFFLLDHS